MKNYLLAELLINLKLLKFFNLIFDVEINQVKMKFPVINILGFQNLKELKQGRETWLDRLIGIILKNKSGTFIDVGVNIGQTLLKVKAIDLNQDYIGFEPNPSCCFYTSRLIQINKFNNCKIIPVGLADKSSLLKLFMRYGEDDPCASIVENYREASFYSSEKYVFVCNGDSLVKELNIDAISIIKIDVEGAELEVIQGLRSSIAKYQPFILCEILPIDESKETEGFRKTRQDILDKILREEGYLIGRISPTDKVEILDAIETSSNSFDYVFIPSGMRHLVELF
jgi:FkbM family methyltransferase